jgi:hypothetical protein
MRRSPDSLKRGLIINPGASLSVRLTALKEIKPTRRFLEHLLKEPSLPAKLLAEASRILLSLPRKSKSPGVPNPKEPSPVPVRASEFAGSLTRAEPVLVEPELDSEGRQVIDPVLWDALTLAGTSLFKPIPGCVRGPDLETPPPPPEQTPESNAPHKWREK